MLTCLKKVQKIANNEIQEPKIKNKLIIFSALILPFNMAKANAEFTVSQIFKVNLMVSILYFCCSKINDGISEMRFWIASIYFCSSNIFNPL